MYKAEVGAARTPKRLCAFPRRGSRGGIFPARVEIKGDDSWIIRIQETESPAMYAGSVLCGGHLRPVKDLVRFLRTHLAMNVAASSTTNKTHTRTQDYTTSRRAFPVVRPETRSRLLLLLCFFVFGFFLLRVIFCRCARHATRKNSTDCSTKLNPLPMKKITKLNTKTNSQWRLPQYKITSRKPVNSYPKIFSLFLWTEKWAR